LLGLEGQHRALSAAETLYNVYCAKKNAELAPGVGRVTDLAIISKHKKIEAISMSDLGKFEKLRQTAKQKSRVDRTELQGIYDNREKTAERH
jgi:hypothetical protein